MCLTLKAVFRLQLKVLERFANFLLS
ncbi:hypothetical protein [Pseudoalteromonas sp. MMG005]|nr:hypothetical protein [Pseudoalteromonas sp. MMG005]